MNDYTWESQQPAQPEDGTPAEQPSLPRKTTRSRRFQNWISGGIVGFTLGVLLVSGSAALAQVDGADETSLGQRFFENLAENLGITTDELDTAIDDAGTSTIDEAVTNGELTEQQGNDLKERLQSSDGLHGFGFGFGFGDRGPRHGHGRHFVHLDTIARTIGMTADELRAELEDGAELQAIITDQGSTVEEVVDALVAEVEATLADDVADGRITQEQADAFLDQLPSRLTETIENGMFGPRHGCPFDLDGQESDSGTDYEAATPEA